MTIQTIKIADIDRGRRLRPIDPKWSATMAERLAAGERLPPIEVVETAPGAYRLISGGHRTEAHVLAGLTTIEADVRPASDYPSEAWVLLREAQENLVRYELTALDRAVHLSTWKDCHEEIHGAAKRGRKPVRTSEEELAQNSAAFAGTFSAAAAAALRISERSVQVAVQVARQIPAALRERIAHHPIADVMSELVQLSRQGADRQGRIVALILAEQARTVADAVAMLDRTPQPERLAGWQKLSDGFGRLKEGDRYAFFDAHADAIDLWRAARGR